LGKNKSQHDQKKKNKWVFVTESSCNHIKAFLSTLLALLKIKATLNNIQGRYFYGMKSVKCIITNR